MATMATGWLVNKVCSTYKYVTAYNVTPLCFIQVRNYAARKGTREKARKKKVKVVVEKLGFIPHKERVSVAEKKQIRNINLKVTDAKKLPVIDNVWLARFHKWKYYPFAEAVQCHRETHHPTMYNLPNSNLQVLIELNLYNAKKTKIMHEFSHLVRIPHTFDHGEEREIVAFCKTPEDQKAAREAGATFVGGRDLIKQAQTGEFSLKNLEYIVAHTSILPDLLLIKGLIRKQFPSTKTGSLGDDITKLVHTYRYGIKYKAIKHPYQPDFATITTSIGTLNMETEHLEENFKALISQVETVKPKRDGPLILRVQLLSPPSREKFLIDIKQSLSEGTQPEVEEDDDVTEAVIPSY
ncbi:hypothetical protein KM043_007015 [Ampulex compressa]|nr:hypothetical protein KM043_007015 [Ampulex compressa]